MKKLVVTMIGLLCFAPAALADNWGAGLRLGAAQNDPKTLKEYFDAGPAFSSKELDKGYGVFGLEGLYEWNLNDEVNKIGVKLGLDVYGENKLNIDHGVLKVTETTYAFPITVYYKQDYGVQNWSWFAGAGVTILRTEIEAEAAGVGKEDHSKSKVFPHLTIGAEYRFCRLFALGLDVKYNIAAKVKKDGEVWSDRSGFGAAITGRFYF